MLQKTATRKRELRPRGARRVDSNMPVVKSESALPAITIKALNGKEYSISPLPDDPAELTFQVGKDVILEAIKGKPE
jgi:hypothetical protein